MRGSKDEQAVLARGCAQGLRHAQAVFGDDLKMYVGITQSSLRWSCDVRGLRRTFHKLSRSWLYRVVNLVRGRPWFQSENIGGVPHSRASPLQLPPARQAAKRAIMGQGHRGPTRRRGLAGIATLTTMLTQGQGFGVVAELLIRDGVDATLGPRRWLSSPQADVFSRIRSKCRARAWGRHQA